MSIIRNITARDLLAKIDHKGNIFSRIDDLESNVNKVQRSEIMAEDISDISSSLGTIVQGEQAYGEGSLEGGDYTGMIIRYPALTIDGVDYSFIGMNNGVLQVGLSYTDGKIYAGAGAVSLDENGITATAGQIGGWNLGANDFTSDSGSVKISSLLPSIEMGASGFTTGEGIWFGKDGGTYKFRLGTEQSNVSPQYVTWDGSELKVMGNVSISAGATIGGWLVGANDLSSDTGSVSINSAIPSVLFGATDYSTGSGIWMGKDSGIYKLRIGDPAGQYLTWDGNELKVIGAVSISAGATIGGWVVGTTNLMDAAGLVGLSSAVTGGDDVRYWAGHTTPESAPFRVTKGGVLTAKSADVGGWTVDATSIKKTGIVLDSSTDSIYVGSAVPRIVIDGTAKSIHTDDFVSGSKGFNIDGTTGDVEVNSLLARGELRGALFSVGEIEIHAGNQITTHSAGKVYADFVTPGVGSTVTVEITDAEALQGACLFSDDDYIQIKRFASGVQNIWFQVTGDGTPAVGYQTYTFTQMAGEDLITIPKDTVVADWGAATDGYISQTAENGTLGNSPNLSMGLTGATPWVSKEALLRIGNLNGYLGYSSDIYGFGFGSALSSISWDAFNNLRIRGTLNNLISLTGLINGYSHEATNNNITRVGQMGMVANGNNAPYWGWRYGGVIGESPTELIDNGGFEDGLDHWTATQDYYWYTNAGMVSTGSISVIKRSGNYLYYGGEFTSIGGTAANNIARYDTINNTWSALGAGVDAEVSGIFITGTDVYVAGYFTLAGGDAASCVALWDGANWSALGDGVDGQASDIVKIGTDVYICGGFSKSVSNVASPGIIRWDGSDYQAMGSGLIGMLYQGQGYGYRMVVDSAGGLYVVGVFTSANSVASTHNIAKWSGGSFSSIGDLYNSADYITDICIDSADNIYITGSIPKVGGQVITSGIAKHTGAAWSEVGYTSSNLYTHCAMSADDVPYFINPILTTEWKPSIYNWSGAGDVTLVSSGLSYPTNTNVTFPLALDVADSIYAGQNKLKVGVWSVSTAVKNSGAKSAKFDGTGGSLLSDSFALTAEATYHFAGWVRDGIVSLDVTWSGGGQSSIFAGSGGSGVFVYKDVTVIAPAGTTWAKVKLTASNASETTQYFDDYSAMIVSLKSLYFDDTGIHADTSMYVNGNVLATIADATALSIALS